MEIARKSELHVFFFTTLFCIFDRGLLLFYSLVSTYLTDWKHMLCKLSYFLTIKLQCQLLQIQNSVWHIRKNRHEPKERGKHINSKASGTYEKEIISKEQIYFFKYIWKLLLKLFRMNISYVPQGGKIQSWFKVFLLPGLLYSLVWMICIDTIIGNLM